MSPKIHAVVVALAAFLICPIGQAQSRNAVSPIHISSARMGLAARAAAPVPTAPVSASNAGTSVIHVSPSGHATRGRATSTDLFALDDLGGVPGLGFDFPHLAAISGGLGNTGRSHFGHHDHGSQGFFAPIFFGGYPYYYDDLGADQSDQQSIQPPAGQPQIIVIQQPAPERQEAGPVNDGGNLPPSAAENQTTTRVPDVGDFIFVRRDGRVLFASVFSVVGEQLQYVTPEGIRHTLAMSDLDTDATQQMNEARGTTLQFRP